MRGCILRRPRFRKSLVLEALAAIAAAAFPLPSLAQTPIPPLPFDKTEVVLFEPPLPPGPPAEGYCWTASVAVTRPGAFRCSVGNSIEDPCFTVKGSDELVCGADPAFKKDGFAMKPLKPLPQPKHRSQIVVPWVFRLADSSICEAMTGTLKAVNGIPARWSCAIYIRDQIHPTGVVTRVIPGNIWMAERYPEEATESSWIGKAAPEMVPVKILWE
ncbi:MAG: hypothetical protein JWM69_1574 [Candidatus Binatus sp.]|nr:hypothetical protein [Candidatus Binatus sp.]